jgi:Astacin (Peptidase family M12A)
MRFMKSVWLPCFAGALERVNIFLVLVCVFVMPLAVCGANFYAGISPTNVPWPGGIVPYEFTNALTSTQQVTYLDGLREWELAGYVKFVPHTMQTNWILFTYNTNFIDYVAGGSRSPQVVTISSLSRAQVCHEMGHSFGFNHENIRTDAPNYILVLTNNITNEPANIVWFSVDPTTVSYGNYDFESVMHLGWDFDSTEPTVLATQQPKPLYFPRYQYRMGNYCLSPGDRAALAYLYGSPAVPLTNIVTATADVGPGSLRAAIYYATDHPGTTIRFDIPTSDPGYSNGVFYIHLTGMLPPLVTDGTIIDGSTQPGFAGNPLIFVDGSQMIPEAYAPGTASGLLIYAANCQVKNLAFNNFNWNGLTLLYADATNNIVSGCWFGLDFTGSNATPNAYQGIYIAAGASRNIIGGTNALERNVLSGNAQYGVYITGSNTTGNIVLGNYIGTDFSGTNAVPNGKSGVLLGGGASGNIIGSTNPAGRNILSGNTEYGIWISNTVNNVILGNYIGTDASGGTALGNQLGGIGLFGGTGNIIGGTVAGARNVISGNTNGPYYDYGVLVANPVASGNVIEGNYIGLGADGTTVVPNYYGVYFAGGATNNTLGGTVAGAGNYVSGNISYDVSLSDPGTSGNLVEGNFVGTDSTGTNGIAGFINVELQNGATGNSIGGVNPGAGNVITAASFLGVALYDADTTNNAIRGNSIFGNYMGIHLFGNYYYPYVNTNHVGFLPGPNNLQNFPVITNAFGYGTSTVISGTLNSAANGSFPIDVYRNFQPDENIGGYGEGQFYLGTVSVTTDGSGNANFSLTNTAGNYAGQYITATATDANGNTSEFDLAVLVTNLPVASAQFIGPYQSRTNGFAFSLNLATNFSYRVQAATNLAAPIAWTDLTNFTATNSPFSFIDHSATNYRVRFYRVISP